MTKWNIEELNGYKPMTTFWNDFDIAEAFGVDAIKDTFQRAFKEWCGEYKYLTELVLVLNHKIWQHYQKNEAYAQAYNEAWEIADGYACDNLQGEELNYFYKWTD